jgi:cation:H+ antiporter
LGISAAISPFYVSKQLFRFDIPAVVFLSFLFWFFLRDNTIGIFEGITFLILLIAYLLYNLINAKNEEEIKEPTDINDSVIKNTAFIVAGLVSLMVGANFLVRGAVMLAQSFGVSEAVIGLTIVALGTSLPELATSVLAAAKKQNEIAIGNIVGSNIFNIICILGVVGVMGPIKADGILLRDVLIMIGLTVFLFLPLLTKNILTRWTGTFLLGIYGIYMTVIIFAGK